MAGHRRRVIVCPSVRDEIVSPPCRAGSCFSRARVDGSDMSAGQLILTQFLSHACGRLEQTCTSKEGKDVSLARVWTAHIEHHSYPLVDLI